MATWLDTFFYNFDHSILEAVHNFTLATGEIFTLPLEMITFLANGGICMLLLGALLCCFQKSRRVGLTVLFAVGCGAVITNLALKNMVVRTRPYADQTRDIYQWWVYISENSFFGFTVSDHSFPSGHTTATAAAMTAIFRSTNKKKSWPVFILVVLMGFSRLYLMVHYPTDVLAGLIAGVIGAIAGFYLIKLLYRFINSHGDNRLVRFYLDFDLIVFIRGLLGSKSAVNEAETVNIPSNGAENSQTDRDEQ